RTPAERPGYRAPPRQDRGRDRERAWNAVASRGGDTATTARLVASSGKEPLTPDPEGVAGDHTGVRRALESAQARRVPLRRPDDGVLDDAGLRDRERPPRHLPCARRGRARDLRRACRLMLEPFGISAAA